MRVDARLEGWLAAGEQAGQRYTLAPPRQLTAGTAGVDVGRGCGASVEFMDHREYQPGDDLRHLDWSASARRDRPVVKLFREEVSPSLDLVLDGSRSMALAGTTKAAAAAGMAALLAAAARTSGWSTRAWLTGDTPVLLAAEPVAVEAYPVPLFGAAANPTVALSEVPPQWRARSVRVLVSDLLFPGSPEPVLHCLGSGAAAAAVIQIVAEADLEPPVEGSLRLVDVETSALLDVDITPAMEARYRDALARHQEMWRRAARALGVALFTVVAERMVEAWDVSALVEGGLLQVAP